MEVLGQALEVLGLPPALAAPASADRAGIFLKENL